MMTRERERELRIYYIPLSLLSPKSRTENRPVHRPLPVPFTESRAFTTDLQRRSLRATFVRPFHRSRLRRAQAKIESTSDAKTVCGYETMRVEYGGMHSLIGSLGCQSTAPTDPLCSPNLYKIFPLSTSQTVTVLSPPPQATRAPPSVWLH